MKYMSDREIDRISGRGGQTPCRGAEGAPCDRPCGRRAECAVGGRPQRLLFSASRAACPCRCRESLARLIQENARAAELSRAGVREYSAGRGKRLGA